MPLCDLRAKAIAEAGRILLEVLYFFFFVLLFLLIYFCG